MSWMRALFAAIHTNYLLIIPTKYKAPALPIQRRQFDPKVSYSKPPSNPLLAWIFCGWKCMIPTPPSALDDSICKTLTDQLRSPNYYLINGTSNVIKKTWTEPAFDRIASLNLSKQKGVIVALQPVCDCEPGKMKPNDVVERAINAYKCKDVEYVRVVGGDVRSDCCIDWLIRWELR